MRAFRVRLGQSYRVNRILDRLHRWGYRLGLHPFERGQARVVTRVLERVLARFPEPTAVETGCIRDAREGTAGTLTIARILGGRGRFFTFELEAAHIRVARDVCAGFADAISFVEGDSVEELAKLIHGGTVKVVHFAFLDSADDGEHIFREFRLIEPLVPPGGIVVIDDAMFGTKGTVARPYLERHPDWNVRLCNIENGLLIAERFR